MTSDTGKSVRKRRRDRGVDDVPHQRSARSSCVPTRVALFKKFKGLAIKECPFVNLPERRPGRWGQGLTKDKMKDCVWLKPVLVAQIEFLEWTGESQLRHSKFVGLREDKKAKEVVRE